MKSFDFVFLIDEMVLTSECLDFNQHFFFNNNDLIFYNWQSILEISFLTFLRTTTEFSSLFTFINTLDDLTHLNNFENITSIYHYSIPNVKLFYPEPFIASASLMHSDLWFVHILIYQYWLWFVFIFIIIFFFITFLSTVRWCNMRIRPKRETRGVSRSKCGDLITACVPVSWATSIIINESTDAIDYYDGFGTTEMIIGIRAYQWGWEYYYPKDIDLHHNIKNNYSSFVGNSLKYNVTSDRSLTTLNIWKFFQNKSSDAILTPAYVLLCSIDNNKFLNLINLNDIGINFLNEMDAFKKTKMISKFDSSYLNFSLLFFNQKFNVLNFLFTNENSFLESISFGIKKQFNFLSSMALNNKLATNFNKQSFNKLISFNLKISNSFNILSQINKDDIVRTNSLYFFFNKLSFNSFNLKNQNYYLLNNTKLKFLIKKTPMFNFFQLPSKKNKIFVLNNTSNDFYTNNKITNLVSKTINKKIINLFSTNAVISFSEKSIRKHSTINPFKFNVNFFTFNSKINLVVNSSTIIELFKTKYVNLELINKLKSNKVFIEYPYSPIISNNFKISLLDYDNYKNTLTDTPIALQGKEELIPNFILSSYWNFYWSNTNFSWRILSLYNFNHQLEFFYFPFFSFYYDYDFRNWQSTELIEDSFWDSSFSQTTFDDYIDIKNYFYENQYFNKYQKIYLNGNRLFRNKFEIFEFSFKFNNLYANTLYNDDCISPINLISLNNLQIFPFLTYVSLIDDSYESFKNLLILINNYNQIIFLNTSNFFTAYIYSWVFDMYRSNYDEFSWFSDKINFKKSYFNQFDWFLKNNIYNNINFFFLDSNFIESKTNKFSNNINLRSSVKNALVNYNAIQKVFKTRFDENKANVNALNFSALFSNQPYINTSANFYTKLLGKNKINYFNNNYYKSFNFRHLNYNFFLNNSLNFYFYDFPFLLGLKSDMSKHIWFDWFSKWGFCDIQPSSTSKYLLHGMPFFNKIFDFNMSNNEILNETENYFARISKARKNYLPNWTYVPYMYSKNHSWFKNNLYNSYLNEITNDLILCKLTLNEFKNRWENSFSNSYYSYLPSDSNYNSYARSTWVPHSNIFSYYYNTSTLIDILTKREYFYRQFLLINNKAISLPLVLTNNLNNPLINDVKSLFNYVDSISYNSEFSKLSYYNSITSFNQIQIKKFLPFYLNAIDYNTGNKDLMKNQYRPIRKGINNMIRLHASGAIAMPIEIRIQILASSKDVIHSWAIPSAGVKIDCVPGYTSHKVTIFLVSGIFWGQCMEVCGRYHHWMPIVVYFMKRDLFFLWCTHFVFLSGANNLWTINDRQYTNYLKLVSYDKTNWIKESNFI
jgi:heme/copper-type cytochrome/quinol oxidase subunit 2